MARRLNTKFFLALTIGVAVVGGTILAASKLLQGRGDGPERLEQLGDQAMASGNPREAIDYYRKAVSRVQNSATYRRKLGEAHIRLVHEETQNLLSAHTAWREAIAVDRDHPDGRKSLDLLVNSLWEYMDVLGGTDATMVGELRNRAAQLASLDKNNVRAAVISDVAAIRQWYIGQPIPEQAVVDADKDLAVQATRDPSNSDAAFWLAMRRFKLGRTAASGRSPNFDLAQQEFARADAIITAAMKGQEKNSLMQYRAYQVLMSLASGDMLIKGLREDANPVAPTTRATTQPGRTNISSPLMASPYSGRASEAIARALENVTPTTPRMHEIYAVAAIDAEQRGDSVKAREIRKLFIDRHPTNQHARLLWARQLATSPVGRPEAIKLLSQEVTLPEGVVGIGVRLHDELKATTLTDLVRLRLLEYRATPDADTRAKIMAAVDLDMQSLRRLPLARGPRVLGTEGQVLLAKGDNVKAVQVLSDAYNEMISSGGAKDYETILVLAQTYVNNGQPGLAINLCAEIVREQPGNKAARLLLAQQLVQANRLLELRPHMEYLAKYFGDDPTVRSLSAAVIIAQAKDPSEARRIVEVLPETTIPDKKVKYAVAQRAELVQMQVQLLIDILKEDDKDLYAAQELTRLYRAQNLPDAAKRTVEAGLKHHPDDQLLKLLSAELGGATKEQLRDRALKDILEMKDPYARAMRLYEWYKSSADADKAIFSARDALAAAKPGSKEETNAHALLFAEFIARKQWDNARPHLQALVAANYDEVGGGLVTHRWHVARAEYAEAEAVAQDLVNRFPQFAQCWFALGQAQEAQGKWNLAIRALGETVTRQPTNYDALRVLVDTLYNAGRTDEAEQRLREMYALFANDPVVFELLHGHWANFGKPELAIPGREEKLRKNPKDPWSYLALAATYFKNAQRLGAINKGPESREEVDKAFKMLLQGQQQFPDDPRFYAQAAEIHQYNGKVEAGEQVLLAFCQRELAKPPPAKIRPEPWIALAEFYQRSGQPEKVVEALNQALVRSDNSIDVRLKLVSALVQSRKFSDATIALQPVINEKDPRVGRARLEILVAQGSLREAETEIRNTLKTREGADLRNLLASVLIDLGRPADAETETTLALEQERTNETSRYLRALSMSRQGRAKIDPAIEELNRLIQAAPRNVPARLLLSDLLVRTGRRSLAVQTLSEGLDRNPGIRDLRLGLIRLYRDERPPNFEAAGKLIRQAEEDPVMKTDPTWPRESAMLAALRRGPNDGQAAIMKMRLAQQMNQSNLDMRRELIEMLLQFNDIVGAMLESERLEREGVSQWWVYHLRGMATARQVSRERIRRSANDPADAARIKTIHTEALTQFDRALKMLDGMPADVPATINAKAQTIETVIRAIGVNVSYDEALSRNEPRTKEDADNRWKLLGVSMLRAKGDYASAATQVEKMLADPSNAPSAVLRRTQILIAAADVYTQKADYARAKQCYIDLLALNNKNLLALNNLASLLAETITPPAPQEAKKYSEQAYQATMETEGSPAIMDTHGWVLVLCGGRDVEAGLTILKTVVEQSPQFIEARYHLAEAYLRQGIADTERAVVELRTCLQLIAEEDKLNNPVEESLRNRVQTALGKLNLR